MKRITVGSMRRVFTFSFDREARWMVLIYILLPLLAALLFIGLPGFLRSIGWW